MKDWISKRNEKLSPNSKTLFEEAYLCYTVKANRASLLLSYLGFLTIIKERIISSKKKQNISIQRWDHILKELNDDDKWEKRVFEELNNSSSTSIFNISPSIRKEIGYWKDRRNDCAHYKENEINHNHVEALWSFIRSNLSKITLEGGMLDLLKKITMHFDETKTPPDADYKYLLKEIDTSIEVAECEQFFTNFYNILYESTLVPSDDVFSEIFYDMFISIEKELVKKELIKFIKSSPNFDLQLIANKPQLIHELVYSAQDIREIWKSRVNSSIRNINRTYKYYIYSTLLINNLIPQNQIHEAMLLLYENFNQESFNNLPKNDQIRRNISNKELLNIIYSKLFENASLSQMKHKEINSKADLIELFIEFNELSSIIVKELFVMPLQILSRTFP